MDSLQNQLSTKTILTSNKPIANATAQTAGRLVINDKLCLNFHDGNAQRTGESPEVWWCDRLNFWWPVIIKIITVQLSIWHLNLSGRRQNVIIQIYRKGGGAYDLCDKSNTRQTSCYDGEAFLLMTW